MSKEDNVVMQGDKKFNKELLDAVGVQTVYCEDCGAYHAQVGTYEWDPEELKMPIEELAKLSEEGKAKAPKEEVDNVVKLYRALKIRRII